MVTMKSSNTINKGLSQRQTTILNPISCSGIGVHTNKEVSLNIKPAPADSGIIFHRTDLGSAALISAEVKNVVDTRLCTVLSKPGYGGLLRVATVEHLMAALFGCKIDNALIEIDGPEVPIMDGSAAPFVYLLERSGKKELDELRRAIKVTKEIKVENEERFVKISPADNFSISCEINFDHSLIGRQLIAYSENNDFKDELSRARTFCMETDILKMRSAGLALGGSLNNAVVFSEDNVLNEGGLRFPDEPVRHKALDLVGDLALAGYPIIGRVEAICPGHAMNFDIVSALLSESDSWEVVYIPFEEAGIDFPIAAAGGGA